MHRLAGGFSCYKYVTDMSTLTHVFTDLPYFLRKNTDLFSLCTQVYFKKIKEVHFCHVEVLVEMLMTRSIVVSHCPI